MDETNDPLSRWIPLLLFLTGSYLSAFIGWFAIMIGLPIWYQTLAKPIWSPPNGAFAPIITILYAFGGIAGWRVWSENTAISAARRWGLVLYWISLFLSALWTWIFFAWHKIGIAFGEISVLDFFALATFTLFLRLRPKAGVLLLPYTLWLIYETALNFSVWRMNR